MVLEDCEYEQGNFDKFLPEFKLVRKYSGTFCTNVLMLRVGLWTGTGTAEFHHGMPFTGGGSHS
eukprot:scaffold656473_cov74-Prasinocladus_malaysianus.AAC.1